VSTNAVRAEYDAIGQAASSFEQLADQVGRMADHLSNSADALRPDWIGQGANAFYDKMDSSILPAFGRLARALLETSRVLTRSTTFFTRASNRAWPW